MIGAGAPLNYHSASLFLCHLHYKGHPDGEFVHTDQRTEL